MKRLIPFLCGTLLIAAPTFAQGAASKETQAKVDAPADPATDSKNSKEDKGKMVPGQKKEQPKDGVLVNFQPGSEKAETGKVSGSYAQVRESPSLNAPVVGKKVRGDSYTVINESRNWLRVRFEDGLEGFLYAKGGGTNSESEFTPGSKSDDSTETKAEPLGLPPIPDLATSSPSTDTGRKGKAGEKGKEDKKSDETKADEKKPDKSAQEGKEGNTALADIPLNDAKAAKDKKGKKDSKEAKDKKDSKIAKDSKSKADEKNEKPQDKKTLAEASVPSDGTAGPRAGVTSSRTAEDCYNQAIEFFERKRYQEALEANQSALELAPRNAEILNNLGNCLYKLDKLEEAISRWKEALGLSPRSAKICNNLGIAYYQNDDNAKAVEYYKKAILFEPQFPDPYYNLASVYGFKGQFDEALEQYKKYLEFPVDQTMKRLTEERIDYCEKQISIAGKKKAK